MKERGFGNMPPIKIVAGHGDLRISARERARRLRVESAQRELRALDQLLIPNIRRVQAELERLIEAWVVAERALPVRPARLRIASQDGVTPAERLEAIEVEWQGALDRIDVDRLSYLTKFTLYLSEKPGSDEDVRKAVEAREEILARYQFSRYKKIDPSVPPMLKEFADALEEVSK